MPTLTRTLRKPWAVIGLVWSICLVSLSGCQTKPQPSVIIPDSKDLRMAWTCPPSGTVCTEDLTRVTIDLGYLREIMRGLEACTK